MSKFADRTNRYAEHFQLSRADRLRLMMHYPQFKLIHTQAYGAGWKRRAARLFVPIISGWSVDHYATGPGGTVRVPLKFAPNDIASFMEIFYECCYDVDLATATTYVDAGANIGMAASYFATQYPLERMLLIEANPDLIETISNTSAGIAHRVDIEHSALSAHEGTVFFTVSNDHRMSGISYKEGRTVMVTSRTLRSLLDEHNFAEVDILKMDIEGAEHDVLASDPEVLRRVRCLVGELHYSRRIRDATAGLIADQGFEVKLKRGDEVDTLVAVRL